jgi:hypothetical protein
MTGAGTSEYLGFRRDGSGDAVVRRVRRHKQYLLPARFDLWNHSPTGFEWGYGGSGPAQLALAILADALDDDARASKLHQEFKWNVIARLDRNQPWLLSRAAVLAAVNTIEREREAAT